MVTVETVKRATLLGILAFVLVFPNATVAEDGHDDDGQEEGGIHLTPDVIKEFGIKVQQAKQGTISTEQSLTGEIALIPRNVIHIASPVEGIVTHVEKSLGDRVEAGDVLATLESRELATARAGLMAARSREKLAKSTYEREKNLFEKKISSESDYLAAEQGYAASKIEAESARHRLLALGVKSEELSGNDSHDSLTRYTMSAAASGMIIEKHITRGELIGPNSRSFVVADLNQVWVSLTVYQKDLRNIRKGMSVRIMAPNEDLPIVGEIEFISPIIDRETRSTSARVIIENPRGSWKPGMFVEAKVALETTNVPIVLPRSAIQTVDDGSVVFVQHDDEFEVRPVILGIEDSANVSITSGVSAGEVVATHNAFTLKAELQKAEFGDSHGH